MRYQHWIICLVFCLTAVADISKDAIRQAYFETFAVRLADAEALADTSVKSVAVPSKPPLPPLNGLPCFPGYQWLTIDKISWNVTVLAAAICLGSITAATLLRFHRRWHEPQAIRLREAKTCLRTFAQSPNTAFDESVIDALRTISGAPPGASLSAIALRLEKGSPDVAAACRTVEQARFNAADSTAANQLKQALRIGIPCLLCLLAGCEGVTRFKWYSDWTHGQMLASQGKLYEATAIFETLVTAMPSCEALSETMARLRTAVPPKHSDTATAWQLHAKTWLNSRQFSHRCPWLNQLPELALPVITSALLLSIYVCFRHRWRLAMMLALTALTLTAMTAFPLAKRLSLRSQAIALAELRRTPDSDGEPLAPASIRPVLLLSVTADGNYYRVQSATVTGWIPACNLLLFTF